MLFISDGLMAAFAFVIATYPGNPWLFAIAIISIVGATILLMYGSARRKREARVAGVR
jgi:low affinity Fe/Cu permease